MLQAICWVAQARKAVKEENISKCGRAGVLNESLSIASREQKGQDPFDELDFGKSRSPTEELEDLICQVPISNEARCCLSEDKNGDDLPSCSKKGDENWEEKYFYI